ncbi:M61 family metallopeptidase [Pleionea sediminis]|uniref:M61 family metallopeptidase n=1 Tax=Pleionea sediminis TaxID=2569479 RepID=UPI0011853DA0|nr:PDZ domain-containing protein [Pleionea sediminis]
MAQNNQNDVMKYQVWIEDAAAHLFRVRLELDSARESQVFSLPQWIPGSYMIRNFARHIVQFKAYDAANQSIDYKKISGSTWQLKNTSRDVILEYQVYAWDLSVRGAHLDQTHAFFNGTSLFLFPEGMEESECELSIHKPKENFANDWVIATSMTPSGDATQHEKPIKDSNVSTWDFFAEDYQELIDHPVEMADLTIELFDVLGVPHQLAIYGKHKADTQRIVADLKLICERQIQIFGELPNCVDKYVFLVTVLGNGYGGLEHRSSTALHCSRKDLPSQEDKSLSDNYINFLTLCSHEYFHTWNVKQIKPASFLPYDLSQETYTEQLWIFEGITSYYEDRITYEAGVINEEQYLKLIAQVITRVYRGAGRLTQSVAESSFDAWTRFYLQGENAPNAIVSYYTKGKLIALCLDLIIRQQTGNKQSLENVMQYLWQSYGSVHKGLEETELESLLKSEFKLELAEFIQQAVYSTEDLPLENLLKEAGVQLTWHTVQDYKNLTTDKDEAKVNLGALVKSHSMGAELSVVYHDSNAHLAGLSAGDIVIAIDGIKVDASSIDSRFSEYNPGDEVSVHSFRRDELMERKITLKAADKNTCSLKKESVEKPSIIWL